MTRGLIFWVIMLVLFIFWLASLGGFGGIYGPRISTAVEYLLLVLLGWEVYGPPVRG